MATNKQKRALRNRQKIANRQPSKERQIKEMLTRLEAIEQGPVNAFTGQPIFTKKKGAS